MMSQAARTSRPTAANSARRSVLQPPRTAEPLLPLRCKRVVSSDAFLEYAPTMIPQMARGEGRDDAKLLLVVHEGLLGIFEFSNERATVRGQVPVLFVGHKIVGADALTGYPGADLGKENRFLPLRF